MKRSIFLTGLTFLACACSAAESGGNFIAQSFAVEVTIKFGYKYLLTLPEGYDEATGKKWPLLVFLHGTGERGDDLNLLGPGPVFGDGGKLVQARNFGRGHVANRECATCDAILAPAAWVRS